VLWTLSNKLKLPLVIDRMFDQKAEGDKEEIVAEASKTVEPASADPASNRVLVVPANLLAWIDAYGAGTVEYDQAIQLFVAKAESPVYDRARLYARTIDEVPSVVAELAKKNFAVMSENGRISEIQRQDQSLQLLVWIVGLGVFLFGVLTVFSVLMDSTDRKRGTIGVLRVMGMSRFGIFVSVLLRATAIGAGATVLSLIFGIGLSAFLGWSPEKIDWLHWKPIVSVSMSLVDLLLVAVGAMFCCGLGALLPAWRASQLDPFDALVEGRFR
jgi:putative ABC transport system permease protein